MAPFGRNFLKARLKSRSESKTQDPGQEVQVWVCQEEKVVCGVSRHTTCADMVQALLEDHRTAPEEKRILQGEAKDYCILERWKGFERALPPLTRILRLWNAWGDQKPFVQFVLVKASESGPASSKRSSKVKGALSKSRRSEQAPAQYIKTLPVERQKRMVRKAFRKLEKIRNEKEPALGADEGEDGINRLVQLIIAQDHTIRHQIHRMRELDLEIERLEQDLCADHESSGQALPDSSRSSVAESTGSQSVDSQLQEYLYTSDGVEQLEAQLKKHRELVEKLSHDIDLEMKSACAAGSEEPQGAAASVDFGPGDGRDAAEVERVKRDLELSMRRGLALHAQVAVLERELKRNQAVLSSKSWECENLAAQLSSLHVTDRPEHAVSMPTKGQGRGSNGQSKLSQILSQTDVTDTDSDTGISSTHSQDSLSPCGDIPPPLDTDV